MTSNLLGIMTNRIGSPRRFMRHAQAAVSAGFAGVLLFMPSGVRLKGRRIDGYVYTPGTRWSKASREYPRVAIDIGYYTKPETVRQSIRVKHATPIRFTGFASGNKWTIQQHLLASAELGPHLLPTKPMVSTDDAFAFAREHGTIMIKPINGKGGKGIVKLGCAGDRWTLHRNGKGVVSGGEPAVRAKLRQATGKGAYLLQRWIDIRNPDGNVFDIRSLVQKDGHGRWVTTGTAVREGPRNSITSNISGGGHAYETKSYLERLFEPDKVEELMKQIYGLSEHIPAHLEADYGKRFAEFGLDFAVDRTGALWLLEANIKPGKSVIRKVYGDEAAKRCFHLHFQFARHLAAQSDKR
ncbi:YheC/YheD family endospore coat-associated protein [Paenibacillus sp. GYB003]|uniref:YheC/YheD family endospore coat-associated protein n=1 Tax=Paenibacillus sp. GYB003 TaxID=2994392 RepID=UPI002F96A5CB